MRGRSVKLWVGLGLLALGAWLLGSGLPPPASPKSIRQVPARRLWPGDSAKRKLQGGGDIHAYEVQLEAGQVLQGKIVARGIDSLRVVLSGPKGKRLLDLEAASGGLPPEPLIALAGASGGYRLEVTASQRGAYEILLDPALPADAAGRRRATAASHLSNGLFLRRGGDAGSWHLAAAELRRALALWDPVADRRERAITLLWLGKVLQELKEQSDARFVYQEALSLLRAEKDQAGEAYAVDLIGRTYYFENEYERALELYHRALALYSKAGDLANEADTLSNIALIHRNRWQTQTALDFYTQALERHQALGGRSQQAIILHNIGYLYLAMGNYDEALVSFQKVVELQHGLESELANEAANLTAMGKIYQNLGRHAEALDSLRKALTLLERLGIERDLTSTLCEIGIVYTKTDRLAEAEKVLNKALGIARRNSDLRGEANSLGNLARVFDLNGREGEAIQLFEKARALVKAYGDTDAEARIVYGAAQAWRGLGDLAAARSLAAEAIDLSESVRAGTASQGLRSAFGEQVHERYTLSIDILMQSHRSDPDKGFDVMAFEVAERAHARSVLDELAEADADLRMGVDPRLVKQEKDLLAQINLLESKRQDQLAQPQDEGSQRRADKLEMELKALITKHDVVLSEIRAASPRYAALIQPRPLTLPEIRREVLDEESLLLSFVLGEPRSYLFVSSPDMLYSFGLPERGRIEAKVKEASRLIQSNRNRAERAEALRELADMLLEPAADLLGGKRLLIVADGALHLVPFAALPEPGREVGSPPRPLVAGHEIVYLPSASALAFLRRDRAHRRPAPHAVAVLADPVFGRKDPRLARALDSSSRGVEEDFLHLPPLQGSRSEADAILSLVPASESLRAVGFDANLEMAKSPLLGQYRIVHFATHGKLDRHPELSGIVLSQFDEQGNRREGFLHALDIYGLDLPVELVVLSACETALGEDVQGEGVSRLTRGFLYAGAKGVVVSLWRVSDQATSELMSHFYRAMLRDGASPAAALREAQLAVQSQRRWEAPYYWAGFVLQGDWK